MTALEYLKQASYIERQIKYDMTEIEELKEKASSISSTGFGDKVSSSKTNDAPFVRVLEMIWDKQEKLVNEIAELDAKKEEIKQTISKLENPDERFVLIFRYLQRMKWEDIAYELNLSRSNVFRLHQIALTKLQIP